MDQARLAPHRLLGTLAITLTILSVGERMSALDIRRIQGALIDVMISHRLQDALVTSSPGALVNTFLDAFVNCSWVRLLLYLAECIS
jgi:hypothetical protein